ncbi:MAG: aspartate 1-decarboxylase [Dehalococcoidia bacterium]|nr:aspartate 1-decarboxylase [Dehalococcoidia bacterium]
MLKSKIHRARVTQVDVDYEGSISIDVDLMEAADILPFEKVHVLDVDNGARFETYAIEGKRGSREIAINGAAARLAARGDTVIILSYASVPEEEARSHTPTIVHVDRNNEITRVGGNGRMKQELDSLFESKIIS